ncbi:hypothetical protein D3C72_1937500 [compost metagenome]
MDGSGKVVNPVSSAVATTFTSEAYLRASLCDFWLQLPVTTKSTAPARDKFSGTMAFSANPPPCMNRILKCDGTANSSRKSASACS